MNGILRNWKCLRDMRLDYHHHFDVIGTSNAMFDELAESSLTSPLAGTRHTFFEGKYVINFCRGHTTRKRKFGGALTDIDVLNVTMATIKIDTVHQ